MKSIDFAKEMRKDARSEIRNDFMIGAGKYGNGKGHSKDNLVRQRPNGSKILTAQECKDLYASNSLVRNIVDIIPEDMTRSGWQLKCENKQLKDGIEAKFKKLKLKENFQKLYADDRLYGDGFMSIGAGIGDKRSGEDLSTPIMLEKMRKLLYVNTFPSSQVSTYFENQDMFSENFGRVEMFEVNRRSQIANDILTGGNMQEMISEKVHHSRIIHQQSIKFPDEPNGRSILESLYDIITVMDTSLWSVGQILYDFSFKIYKSSEINGMSKGDKNEMGMLMDYLFRTEALAIIGTDEDIKKETTSTSGMKDLLDYGWEYLSGAVRMPKSVLKGQEAGTLTGAQYDVMNYYARVTSMQENQLRPQLEYLVRLLMYCSDEGWNATDPDKEEWSIEFNPLWSVDSKTDAEIRKLQAEADQIYITNGVLEPEQVQEKRFGRFGEGEEGKLNIDSADDIDKMAKDVYEAHKELRNHAKD